MKNRKGIVVVLALLATVLPSVGSASAGPISPLQLGVNANPGVGDLSLAPFAGLGLVRAQMTPTVNSDTIVAWAAGAHLQLVPVLGLGSQELPAAASTALAVYVTDLASRYGPGGTFWKQHPQLPYIPVQSYEIGNEPNIPLQYVADNTNLHWAAPDAYAHVYEAARAALHRVDPSGVAIVGGLADSGTPGVSLGNDERWLAALPAGQVDAVGYHPYTFPVSFSQMYSDTAGLRQWMDGHGMQGVPIEINEVGACDVLPGDTLNTVGCAPSIPSAQWGAFVATFTQWALCSPGLGVSSVLPEYWGDLSTTDTNAILSLVSSNGTLTPYGQDYLSEAHWLTTNGCSLLGGSHARVRRHMLTVIVHVTPASGKVTVLAKKGRREVRLRLTHRNRTNTVLRFKARLGHGRWRVTVLSTPLSGYISPQSVEHRVKVRR